MRSCIHREIKKIQSVLLEERPVAMWVTDFRAFMFEQRVNVVNSINQYLTGLVFIIMILQLLALQFTYSIV